MKYLKKLFVVLCIVALMPSTVVFAETSYDYSEEEIITYMQNLVTTFVIMDETELEYYVENAVGWTSTAADTMLGYVSNDTLGDIIGVDVPFVKEEGEMLVVTEVVHYEKCDLEITAYMTDIQGGVAVTDMSFSTIDTSNKTLGEKMATAAFNTLIGISSVFVVLLLICFIISLFKYIPKIEQWYVNRKKDETETAVENTISQIEVKEERGDDTELVAVITAAICAATGASSDAFVVRSIKKVKRRNR